MKTNNKKENKLWTQENYDMAFNIWSRGEDSMGMDAEKLGYFEIYNNTCDKMDDIFRAIRNAIKKRK